MLNNILARLGKRHSETHSGLRLEIQLAREDGRRPLLDPVHHVMHVVRAPHWGDFQQDVGLGGG